MNTKELLARLHRHYIKPSGMPGGVFVPEVGINGSWGSGSRCDAVYAGFTSASGRILVGHELKVSRADWRHELDQAGKADQWADGCHAWYVVAPSTEIVPPEELPAGWGLMVPNPRTKTRMQVVVKSQVKTNHDPPWLLMRSILGRLDILQQAERARMEQELTPRIRKSVREDYEKRAARDAELAARDAVETVKRLEKELGVGLSAWSKEGSVTPEVLAKAIRLVEAAEAVAGDYAHVGYAISTVRRALEDMEGFQAAVVEFQKGTGTSK